MSEIDRWSILASEAPSISLQDGSIEFYAQASNHVDPSQRFGQGECLSGNAVFLGNQ
jgi:hypothetical protein